jgi:hypothetical protein
MERKQMLWWIFSLQGKKRRNNWFIPSIFDAAGREIHRADVCPAIHQRLLEENT